MAITKAAIFQKVQKRLKGLARLVEDIDDELLETLNDVSSRANFIVSSTTKDTTASIHYVDAPAGCRYILIAVIDEGNFLERGSLEDYEKSIEDTASPTEGEPRKFHQVGNLVYLYEPIPDDAYTARFYFVERDDNISGIALEDRFLEVLVLGVLYRLCLGVLQPDPFLKNAEAAQQVIDNRTQNYEGHYEKAIQLLRNDTPSEPKQIKYRDI